MEGEKDGLPEFKASKRLAKQAKRLVATHRAKNAFMKAGARRTQNTGGGVDPEELAEALRRQGLATNDEAAKASASTSSRKPVGNSTGVLGSLLRLYDNPHTPSMNSSQATLINGSDDRPSMPRWNSVRTPLEEASENLDKLGRSIRKGTQNIVSGTVRGTTELISRLEERDRPEAARNSGGVFGALQAGALDLAGVASPVASTVKPNPERSGYKLR